MPEGDLRHTGQSALADGHLDRGRPVPPGHRPGFVRTCVSPPDAAPLLAVIAAPPIPKPIAGGLLTTPSLAFLSVKKFHFGMALLPHPQLMDHVRT